MKRLANAAYELQCKLGVLIDRIEEWAFVFWVQPVHGRPYFVSKKSEIGRFIDEHREYQPMPEDKVNLDDLTMEDLGFGSSFADMALARRVDFMLKHPNTYHLRLEIKALGGKWNADERGWKMPDSDAYNRACEICVAYRR